MNSEIMTCDPEFDKQREKILQKQLSSEESELLSRDWISHPDLRHYSYTFDWLGLPIIQYPQDIVAMQELVWSVKPDLIIETGIARGGSLIFYASLLELNALCGGPKHGHVLGIDIDIRPHNRKAIEDHPLFKECGRISMLQSSSIDASTIADVHAFAKNYQCIMVILDSNHTHKHVLAELEAYARLTSAGSYCVVFDTVVEYMAENAFPDRPWGKGDNPMTAVDAYLLEHPEFVADAHIDAKLRISVAPRGYLYRKP